MNRKRIVSLTTLFAVILTLGVWHFTLSKNQQISVKMQQYLQFEEVSRELSANPTYIATTEIEVKNVPTSTTEDYKLNIKVKMYDAQQCEIDMEAITYQIIDRKVEINGVHPVKVHVELKNQESIQKEFHLRVSAEVENKNI